MTKAAIPILDKTKQLLLESQEAIVDIEPLRAFSGQLKEQAAQLDRPTEIMIMGEFNAGKSTFINALLGKEILKSDVTPATASITKMIYGPENKVTLYFLDGEKTTKSLDALHMLSSEQNAEGAAIRENLSHIEVELPVEILRQVTLIDTPGLNSQHSKHSDATARFMHDTDVVFWLFSYTTVGKESEVQTIKQLAASVKVIGVINGIDEHDEEEESLEDFLALSARKLGKFVDGVIGVSALKALKGKLESKELLVRESRFNLIHSKLELLASETETAAAKLRRCFNGLREVVSSMSTAIQTAVDEYQNHIAILTNYDQYKANLFKSAQDLEVVISTWRDTRKIGTLNAYQVLIWPEISPSVHEHQELFLQQLYMFDEITSQKEALQIRRNNQVKEENNLKIVRYQLDKDLHEYNNSGWIFSKPLFDWSGKKAALEQRESEYNDSHLKYHRDLEDIEAKNLAIEQRWARAEGELCEIGRKIEKSMNEDWKKLQQRYRDRKDLRQTKKNIVGSLWVPQAVQVLQKEVLPRLKEATSEYMRLAKDNNAKKNGSLILKSILPIKNSKMQSLSKKELQELMKRNQPGKPFRTGIWIAASFTIIVTFGISFYYLR